MELKYILKKTPSFSISKWHRRKKSMDEARSQCTADIIFFLAGW
jgi:hypothetical protein